MNGSLKHGKASRLAGTAIKPITNHDEIGMEVRRRGVEEVAGVGGRQVGNPSYPVQTGRRVSTVVTLSPRTCAEFKEDARFASFQWKFESISLKL